MPRYAKWDRQRGARLAERKGLQCAAQTYNVSRRTVRDWCHEFDKQWLGYRQSHDGPNETLAVRLSQEPSDWAASDPEILTLSVDMAPFIEQLGPCTTFAPKWFTRRLAEVLPSEAGVIDEASASKRLHEAVGALQQLVETCVASNNTLGIGPHVELLREVVAEVDEVRREHGVVPALEALRTALSSWGATGPDVSRVPHGGDPVWDARRRKAEDAMELLLPKMRAHEEYDYQQQDPLLARLGNEITADVRFERYSGREIFQGGWDCPELVGRSILRQMAVDAAAEVGLQMGTEARFHAQPSEKGWVEVGYEIIEDDD